MQKEKRGKGKTYPSFLFSKIKTLQINLEYFIKKLYDCKEKILYQKLQKNKGEGMKQKTKNLILFFILFVITGVVFWNYVSMHYATDTYNIMNIGYEKYAINNSLSDGRIFMFLIGMLANTINIPITVYVITLTVIGLIISCIAVIILKNMIMKFCKKQTKLQEVIAVLIAYCTIFNFMYVENLYFVEAAVMACSVLLYILAVKQIIDKKKLYILKSAILAIIATFCYQGTIGLFALYGVVFSIAKNGNNIKEILKDFCIIILITIISFVANLIQIDIATYLAGTTQKRLNGIQNLLENFIYVLSRFGTMVFDTMFIANCGLFPNYLMMIFVLVITLMAGIYEVQTKQKGLVFNIIFLFIVTLLITFAMCIVSIASYDTGRIHVPVGALIGVIFIYLFCKSNIFEDETIIKYLIITTLITYNLLTVVNTISLLYQHKQVNKLEKEQCEGLEAYIESYEEENDVKITEARYFKLSNMKKYGYFDEIKNESVLTYDGVACTWSAIGTINFYTGRNFADNYLEAYPNRELFYEYAAKRKLGYEGNFVIMDNILYFLAYI